MVANSMCTAKVIFFVSAFIIIIGCGPRAGKLHKLTDAGIPYQEKNSVIVLKEGIGKNFSIQYLGCGGLYILKDGDGILIDPFFSNQKISSITKSLLFGNSIQGKRTLSSNPLMIEKGLRSLQENNGDIKAQVRAIFSTHSHYDHLMDIPAVFEKLNGEPRIFLNRSGYNTCFNVIDTSKMNILEDYITTRDSVKPPIEIKLLKGKVRVYPVEADHNPHFKFVKFFSGAHTKPLKQYDSPYEKTHANDWLEGNTFSFLIDYLDADNHIDLRIFIQSSSCNPAAGIPPLDLRERPVDLALLGIVSHHFSPDYPCVLLDAIKPKDVIWIHWEDFFRSYDKHPKTVRGTSIPEFFERPCVKFYKDKAHIPWPGVRMDIKY